MDLFIYGKYEALNFRVDQMIRVRSRIFIAQFLADLTVPSEAILYPLTVPLKSADDPVINEMSDMIEVTE